VRAFEIRQGDALALLRDMPTASVDAVVTDPPYGERNANWDGPRSYAWHEEWLLEADRVLRPEAPLVTFASRRTLDILMGAIRRVRGDVPVKPLQTAVWVHRQGHTSRRGFLRPEHEHVIISGLLRTEADDVRALRAYKTPHNMERHETNRRTAARGFKPNTYRPHIVGPMAGTVFEAGRNKPRVEVTGHPTQKPEEVMAYLVAIACAPGGLVLDPFCGSGSTGAVACRLGRRFLGLELNPAYCEMARRRIAGPLFAEASR
jgi:site-specific DNA-methyltransferase (adenine-specific)